MVLVKTRLEEYFCLTLPATQSIYQRLRSKGKSAVIVYFANGAKQVFRKEKK